MEFSSLPLGLQRYTGEQDFDLLVVNDTIPADNGRSTVFENYVPSPFGTIYGVQLFPGLNNILVPRGAFLSSPLGQALLSDSSVNPAVLRGPLTFTPTNWENAVDQNVTSPGTPGYVNVDSSLDMSCGSGPASACQGLASNPGLEPSADQSRQVQAIITFNVSTQAQLDDLLGGLLLNASGNLTGSLLNESAGLPSLGLSTNVLDALASRTLPNSGSFGAPTSSYAPPPPPKPWYEVAASLIVNAVSGVIHLVTGILSVAWNAAVAAAAYLAKAAEAEANALGITALPDQLGNALKAVASAMLQALAALLAAVIAELKEFLTAALSPLTAQFQRMIYLYIHPASLAAGDPGNLANPLPDSFGSALLGPTALTLFTLSAAMVVAAVIGFTVLDGITLGASDAVLIVLPFIIGLLLSALSSATSFAGPGIAAALQSALSTIWKVMADASGGFIIAAAVAENKPLTTPEQQNLDGITSQIDTGTGIVDALLGLGIATFMFLKGGTIAKAASVVASAFSLMLSVISIAVFAYLLTLAGTNDNIHTAVGQALDVSAIAMNFFALAINLRTLLDSGSDVLERRVANLQILMELIGMTAEGFLYAS